MGQVEVPMGPTLLVIASRFRPVWRRPCTRWRSAPGRAPSGRVDRRRASTPPLTAGHLNTAALFFPEKNCS